MKKSHKILLALALLAAAAAVIVISNLPIAKTQEAVGELLRKKLVYHTESGHDALSGCGLPCAE